MHELHPEVEAFGEALGRLCEGYFVEHPSALHVVRAVMAGEVALMVRRVGDRLELVPVQAAPEPAGAAN